MARMTKAQLRKMDARAQKKMQEVYLPDLVGGGYGEMWRTKCRWVAIKGSRRSKKSKTQALKMIYLLLKYPESNGLVVRRFYNTLAASCFTELKWAANRFGIRDCFKFKEHPLEVTYLPTGQKILFRGLDDSLKITSISVEVGALCWVWFEEAYEIEDEEDFNKVCDSIMGALPDGYYKQITLTFNPWSPSTWIKDRFFDVDDPDIFARTTNYLCNEWLSDTDRAEFERMKVRQPNRYRVSGLGEWGVDGAVYFEEFREDVHVITPFPIPDYWKIYRAIDYGLDMLAGLYIAEDPRGNAYVIGEVYKPGLIVSKAAEALRKAEPRAQKYTTYAPPDLWSRTKDSGRSIDELFHEHGVTLTRSSNDRFAGWSQVLERIKVIDGEDGQPTARLKIFSTCRNLIRCLSVIKQDEDNCNDVATEPHELTHTCVTGDTLVKLPDGFMRIDNLVGTSGECRSYDLSEGREVTARYKNVVMTNPAAEIFEVELEDGTKIKATGNHKVLTAAGWKTIEELTDSDDIITV